MTAPIVLFVYNRPWHTQQTVNALLNNALAAESDLFIYSDASKTPETNDAVLLVREYIRSITGFKSVTIVERLKNLGLSNSIIDGVTELTEKFGQVIVLEDDMVTSPYFLDYMNKALELYANDDRVICIQGYVFPTPQSLPETFFLRGSDCWGWATWKRGWALFNCNGQYLLDELNRLKLSRQFNFNDTYPYTKMLEEQIKGNNDSWAVRWYASAFLASKLALYPGRSLVHNIGNDSSGTHCFDSTQFDAKLSNTPIDLNHSEVRPSEEARHIIELFFRQQKTGLLRRILNMVSRSFKVSSK